MPTELVDVITRGGAALAPFLAFLWWTERDERKKTQQENSAMAKEFIPALVELNHVVATLKQLFNSGKP